MAYEPEPRECELCGGPREVSSASYCHGCARGLGALSAEAFAEPERREKPCIGPPECSCPACLRAMIERHAPELTSE